MKRREFLVLTAGALLLPRAARAQQTKRRRIAFLAFGSRASTERYLATFRQGLRALGYDGENLEIEIGYADGHVERLADLAAELVRLVPEVMVAGAPAPAQALKQATPTLPIVIAALGDPVAGGFVASLAHPGGNITGLSLVAPEMAGKQLQLLKAAVPGAQRIAFLDNPGNPFSAISLQVAVEAARALNAELFSVEADSAGEIDGAFAIMIREHAEALIIQGDPVFLSEKSRVVELAARQKLPAIYQFREFVAVGGLMSYGPDLNDLFRHAATYVDKILKGAKPADLPVEQPTKFELVVNLKTAQALGLTIPPSILAGADEVIE
jgi:putative ABC transport system substrate-binding protein